TFTALSKTYAKDKSSVFHREDRIDGADAATFSLMSNPIYGKDANHVYCDGVIVRGANAAAFQLIQWPYARDDAHIFCGTFPMAVHRPEAFEVVMEASDIHWTADAAALAAKDAFGAVVHVDTNAPAVIGAGWARDGVGYYSGPHEVEGADYASFKVLDSV